MNCSNCGTPLVPDANFCPSCGAMITEPTAESVAPVAAEPTAEPVAPVAAEPVVEPVAPIAAEPITMPAPETAKPMTEADLPEEYRPLGPWSYFWLQILFGIPLIGFIFLIIFSFKRSNINRRNFARSYWIVWIIIGSIGLIALVLALLLFRGTAMSSPAMAF